MAAPKLSPPPVTQPFDLRPGVPNPAWTLWFDLVYRILGRDTGTSALNVSGQAATISGVVTSSNLPVGTSANISNDALAKGFDVDATNTTVKVGKTATADQPWNVYRDGVIIYANIPAKAFTGRAYATTYYIGYNVLTQVWTISTAYLDITGDNVIRFVCRTSDSQGVPGAAVSGGGGSADGSTGGVSGSSGGRGMLL